MGPGFDLRQLRYFTAVAEEGSFRRAAERLHLSQPPLSRQVKALEDAVGVALLERGAGGVTLTAAGRKLYDRSIALLERAARLADGLAEEGRGRVRIGIAPGLPPEWRVRLEKAWRVVLARRHTTVATQPSGDLLAALRSGRLEFAVVAYGADRDVDGLTILPLYVDPLVALLPAGHAAARRKRVSLKDAEDLPFFWMPRSYNPSYHDHCAQVFRAADFRPRMRRVEPGLLSTVQRIALGEGWTITNAPMTSTRVAGVAYRPLVEGPRIAVRVAAAWAGKDDPLAGALAKTAARVLRRAKP
jgi:DNA-binding transcriptional LysR family regulator